MNPDTLTPEAVVPRQLAAYNACDIESFMAEWHDDPRYFAHPDELLADGAAAIRARHLARFEEPDLHGRLRARMSVDNLVVDHELVSRNFAEGRGTVGVIAIYQVEGGKIARAWFKRGTPRLETTIEGIRR